MDDLCAFPTDRPPFDAAIGLGVDVVITSSDPDGAVDVDASISLIVSYRCMYRWGRVYGSRLNAENRVTRRWSDTPFVQGVQGYTPVPVTYCSCLQSRMKNVSTLSILYHILFICLSGTYSCLLLAGRTRIARAY